MKKILMLITHLGMGGAEKVFNDHAKALSSFFRVDECVYSKDGPDNFFDPGSELFQLDDETAKTGSLGRFIARRRKLSLITKQQASAVCISHMEGPNILNSLSKLGYCKKILCVHGSITKDSAKSSLKKWLLNRFILRYSYDKADAIVAVSERMRQELISIGLSPEKVHAIPNFFDSELINSLTDEPLGIYQELFLQKKVLLHVGRLSRQKNQKILLQVIAAYKNIDIDTKLCIIGEGDLKDELIRFAHSLRLVVYDENQGKDVDLNADVFFMGAKRNPYKFMKASRLFLLSSFFEGFPLVLGEALACRLPIVSVNCQTGPDELLPINPKEVIVPKDKAFFADCGVLVPDWYTDTLSREQVLVWTNSIREMLTNDALYTTTKNNCGEKIKQFEKETLVNRWVNLIESVADGK